MNISEYVTDLKAATVLDYYVAAFWWAKEQNFNVEQLSAFFTVVHTLLENIKGWSVQFYTKNIHIHANAVLYQPALAHSLTHSGLLYES